MKPEKPMELTDPKAFLKEMYKRHGRIRSRSPSRTRREMRKQTYKKGYEIRIVVKKEKVRDIVKAMKALGIKNGNPYKKTTYKNGKACKKVTYKVIPIYGKLKTESFMKEIVKARRKRTDAS